jgi:hypothetical protein
MTLTSSKETAVEVKQSVVGGTFDLMKFFGRGNYELFRRCFQKAIHLFSLKIEGAERRKYSQLAFHHLRAFGFIDTLETLNGIEWCVSRPVLVRIDDQKFRAICGTNDLRRLSKATNGVGLSLSDPDPINTREGPVPFFPSCPQLISSDVEAVRASLQSGFHLSLELQREVFRNLPSTARVFDGALSSPLHEVAFESGSAMEFNFRDLEWRIYDSPTPSRPGLYMRSNRFSAPQLYVCSELPGRAPATAEILLRSWAAVVGLAVCKMRMQLRFKKQAGELWVPSCPLGYPTILERAFRSGRMTRPAIMESKWQVFSGISIESVQALQKKLQVFEVQYE